MIKWNEVTWYSRMLAIVLFIGIVPALAFYIGTQYQETVDEVSLEITVGPIIVLPAKVPSKVNTSNTAGTSTAATTTPH